MQWRRSVSLNAVVAFSPLVIGLCLLLVALVAWAAYWRLQQDHPSHTATLRLMDTLDRVTPKLETAVGDLMDCEFPYSPCDSSDPASPRHAAVNVRRAAVGLEKAVEQARDLGALVNELRTVYRELKRADVLRGELGYEPLRRRIQEVLSTVEWKILQLAKVVPKQVLERRRKLGQCSAVAFKLSALFLVIAAVFLCLWLSDFRERRHAPRQSSG